MKYLTKGIALSMFSVASAVVAAPAMTQSMSASGFRFGVGLSGIFAKREIKMKTNMQTAFTTRFLAHNGNGPVFTGAWNVANAAAGAALNNQDWNYMHVAINAQYAGAAGVAAGPGVAAVPAHVAGHSVQEAINLVRTGALPATWGRRTNVQGTVAVAATDALLPAILAGSNTEANIGLTNEGRYESKAENTTTVDVNMFGVRGVLELGYDLSESVSVFTSVGYAYEFENKDGKNEKEVSYEVKDEAEFDIPAADGATKFKKKGARALPFAWNKGQLTSGLKAKASVKETFSVVGGLTWKPSENIGLSAFAGIRRYELAVSFEGGSWAYPGNPNLYAEAFRTENNVSKFLIKNEKKHELTAINWALVFGGEFLFMINENHNVTFGISYSSFDAALHADKKKSSDSKRDDSRSEEFVQIEMANPIGTVNAAADMAVPTGWHMLDATNVSTKLAGKLEVTDLTITLGYKFTL